MQRTFRESKSINIQIIFSNTTNTHDILECFQTDGRTDGRTDKQRDGQTEGQTEGQARAPWDENESKHNEEIEPLRQEERMRKRES